MRQILSLMITIMCILLFCGSAYALTDTIESNEEYNAQTIENGEIIGSENEVHTGYLPRLYPESHYKAIVTFIKLLLFADVACLVILLVRRG